MIVQIVVQNMVVYTNGQKQYSIRMEQQILHHPVLHLRGTYKVYARQAGIYQHTQNTHH